LDTYARFSTSGPNGFICCFAVVVVVAVVDVVAVVLRLTQISSAKEQREKEIRIKK